MYSEEDLIPISLLQHYAFCPRRAALIGIEQHWDENEATVDGVIMHEKAHQEIAENRSNIRTRNSMRLHSLVLGLSGIADVVEFHRQQNSEEEGMKIAGADGLWVPFPIEYKRGTTHEALPYHIQLCAQAMCLEEMMMVCIPAGAIFWGENRRRQEVKFDYELRKLTVDIIDKVRIFIEAGKTPAPHYEKKCKGCSLYDICMPEVTQKLDANNYYMDFFKPNDGDALQ